MNAVPRPLPTEGWGAEEPWQQRGPVVGPGGSLLGLQHSSGWKWEEKGSLEGAVPPPSWWGSGAKPWPRRSLLVTHPRAAAVGKRAGDCARAAAGPSTRFMAQGEKMQPV